ncbi:hypothetical protein C8J56DRAFT_859314 [Mycena floridula]|nr:hypothetical protein C8J56DRAFT_859314 [Mycena floridula]
MAIELAAPAMSIHKYTYPPFPSAPDGVVVTKFKDYKAKGIFKEPNSQGEEIDGYGIPTVRLPTPQKTKGITAAIMARNASASNWYEKWDNESKVPRHYEEITDKNVRLSQALSDFVNHRSWPPISYGVGRLYEKFVQYLGILDTTGILKSTATETVQVAAIADDDDVDDDSEEENNEGLPGAVSNTRRSPSSVSAPTSEDTDATRQTALAEEEAKLHSFIVNPVEHVKIFLSSWLLKEGFAWTETNLINAPRVVSGFINFILVQNAFPESKDSFQKAMKVVEMAHHQLPLTKQIATVLPDAFNSGCYQCFQIPYQSPEAVSDASENKTEETSASVVDDQSGWGEWGTIGGDLMEVASTSWGSAGPGTWGSMDNDSAAPPVRPALPFLGNILGMTALPLTHAPGVVEWSVRRIKEIAAPRTTALPISDKPCPEAVESELEAMFTRIVLTPWTGWGDQGVDDKPQITQASNGPVVLPGEDEVKHSLDSRKPHNPMNDDITIFLDSSIADKLELEMGLGGTWVQLARSRDDFGEGEPKRKKRKSQGSGQRYWYTENIVSIFTSFHTPC